MAIGQPAKRVVVVDHCLAIAADLHIGFDAVIALDGGAECRRRVLDHSRRGIMQAAMGDRPCREPPELHSRTTTSGEFEQSFDLDGGVEGQGGHPDGRARVPAFVAEHFDHQVGRAIHDFRSVREANR